MRSLWFVLVTGCIAAPNYTVENGGTAARAAPRAANCAFDILGVPPARPYVEVGQIVNSIPATNAWELDSFREAIAPLVCQSGGDAVIAQPTRDGHWTGGAIVAFR